MNARRGRTDGFTLIEVLITIAVVSIGLLAVAGLQALAKKANYDALQRTTAAALGQAIIERIRANPNQAAIYTGEIIAPLSFASCDPAPGAALPATQAGFCTPAQVAQADLYNWSQELFGAAESITASGSTAADSYLGGLQFPSACITPSVANTVDGTQLIIYTVAIAWRGLSPVSTAGTSSNDPSSNPCGTTRNDGAYNPPATQTSGTMRRILVLQAAVISPPAPT